MSHSKITIEDEFSFDHLTSTQFEEFCFELLQCIGFINVDWRKGTGYSSSPSDQGRDIECERVVEDIDGEVSIEKWFVECKHHKSGVSPDKIQGILSWAHSKRPDKALIIASNFLSNQCKNYLEEYVQKNNPPFRIKYWENRDLEKITQGQSLLLKKYNVGFNFSFLNIIHPNHLNYIKELHINTLDFFFEAMDDIDADIRDKILDFPYLFIINPKIRKSVPKNGTVGDLFIDKMDYETFKSKCYDIEQRYPNISVANYVTDIILKIFIDYGDTTSLDKKIKKLEYLKESALERQKEKAFVDKIIEGGFEPEEVMEHGIQLLNKFISEASENIKGHYSVYHYFCENVLSKLLQEEIWNKFDGENLI